MKQMTEEWFGLILAGLTNPFLYDKDLGTRIGPSTSPAYEPLSCELLKMQTCFPSHVRHE